ncbi:MAG: InlB B-repeat-containing protein [Clostridiales Family XIII bacterium]|nr:InlB B-repeat-containing protein [Clostridiales Family XIII bacterium]
MSLVLIPGGGAAIVAQADDISPLAAHNVTFVLDSGGSTNPADWTLYTPVGTGGVMSIEEGDPVTEPTPPSVPADMVTFRGWSIYDPNNGGAPGGDYTRTDFWGFAGSGSGDIDYVSGDVVLYAVFTDRYLISFKNEVGTVFQTRYIYMDPDYKDVDKRSYTFAGPDADQVSAYVNVPDGQRLMYWYQEGDAAQNPVSFGTVTVTRDTTFVPKFSPAKLVLFNSQGGSSVDPKFPVSGEFIDRPADPTRPGYTFCYWSTDPAALPADSATKEFQFSDTTSPTPVTADTTLYAIWQANNVGYTVVYWVEKANLGRTAGDPATASGAADYDYYNTYPVAAGSALAMDAGQTPNYDSTYWNTALSTAFPFPYKTVVANNNASLTQDIHYAEYYKTISPALAGNGTTVVNVYFTRREYTFQFDMKVGRVAVDNEDTGATDENDTGGYITRGGISYQYGSATNKYSFTAKYEDNIADKWPMFAEALTTTTGKKLYGWNIGNWNGTPHNDVTIVYDWMCAAAERDGGTATYSNDGPYVLTMAPVWQATNSSSIAHSRLYYVEYIGDTTGITFTDITAVDSYTITQNAIYWPQYITYDGQYYELSYGQNGYQTSNQKAQFAALEGVSWQYTVPPNNYSSYLHAGRLSNGIQHFSDNTDHGSTSGDVLQYIFFLYARNPYALAFDMGGATGALPSTLNGKAVTTTVYGGYVSGIKYGESLAAYNPGTPARAGYEFAGWYTKPDYSAGSEFSFTTVPIPTLPAAGAGSTIALTLFAKWTPAKYTVRFYDGLGSTTPISGSAIKVGEGDTINDPGIYYVGQAVEGKGEFIGWVWLVAGTWPSYFGFGGQAVTSDLNLYATWETTGFTVEYDANGGTGTPPTDSKTYVLNERARVLDGSNLTKIVGGEDYVFYGWNAYIRDADGVSWIPQPGAVLSYAYNVHVMTGDTKLVAFYGKKSDSVRYRYNPVITDAVYTGTTSAASAISYYYPKNQTTGYAYATAIFSHDKKELLGWDTSPSGTTVVYALGQAIPDTGSTDVDLYAVWQTKQYELRFVAGANGAISGGAKTVTGVAIDTAWNTAWPPTGSAIVPDAGYHFTSWTPVFPATVTLSQTFTANFAPNVYKIVYDYGTAPIGASILPTDSGSYYYGTAGTPNSFTVAQDASASGSGYAFVGWTIGGTEYSGNVAVATVASAAGYNAATGNYVITLSGIWEAEDQTLTYNLNEPVDATVSASRNSGVASESVKTDARIDTAAHYTDVATNANAPTLTGYDFSGWYLDAVCTTAVGSATMPAGGKTIYAKWSAKTGKVVFDANTTGYSGTMADQSYNYNETKNLTANGYVKAGHNFQGWATSPTGSVVYGNSTSYKYNPDPYTSTVTLYAIWTAGTTVYSVEHYWVDGAGTATLKDGPETFYGTTGYTVTAVPKTIYTGYTYAPDYSSGSDVEVSSGAVLGDGSLVLKLYYTVNRHDVTYAYTGTVPSGAPAVPTTQAGVAFGANVTVAAAPTLAGYTFHGWDYNGSTATSFTMPNADVQLVGSWTANSNTHYVIDIYYQSLQDGTYPVIPFASYNGYGTTDTTATVVAPSDYNTTERYVFDSANTNNVLSGTIAGDGSLHLKVYFKAQYTVTYLPGDQGTWSSAGDIHSGIDWGTSTPAVSVDPTTAHYPGYTFSGWNQTLDSAVKSDRTYLAQWTPLSGVPYTVEHYLVQGTTVTLTDTDYNTGTTNQWVLATSKTYPGYALNPSYAGTIAADYVRGDGTLVLRLFYVAQTYTVTFVDWDARIISVQPGIFYGGSATDPGAQTRAGYTFAGWSTAFNNITADIYVVATYTPNPVPPVTPDPDPDPDPIIITPTETPLAATPDDTVAPAGPGADPVEEDVTTVADPDTSRANKDVAHWALVNLILTALGVLAGLVMLVAYLVKRKEEEDEDNESEKHRRLPPRLVILLAAVIAVMLFLLTEDMTKPMVYIDVWTVVHAVIAVVQVVLMTFSTGKKKAEQNQVRV